MHYKIIAIKRVFSLGYDESKHGEYDRKIMDNYTGRGEKKRERIGKKYQWIALYELAAQMSDNYKIRVNIFDDDSEEIYCQGSFEPHIRDMDTTVVVNQKNSSEKKSLEENKDIHKLFYKVQDSDSKLWVKDFSDIPLIEELIIFHFEKLVDIKFSQSSNNIQKVEKMIEKEREFVLLNGTYEWEGDKKLYKYGEMSSDRKLTISIKSNIISKKHFEKYYNFLKDRKFDYGSAPGSDGSEEYYELYNRTYYWSKEFDYLVAPNEWQEIDNHKFKAMPTIIEHTLKTRDFEAREIMDDAYWSKPCREIFNGLDLKYGKENSVLYDKDDEIICFDTSEIFDVQIGLFIDKNELINFLTEREYTIVWNIFINKIAYEDNSTESISKIGYFDDSGNLIIE